MNAHEIIAALGGRHGMARCPTHPDRTPSLSVRDGQSGPLVTCHAGCDRRDVIAALRDLGLWPERDDSRPALKPRPQPPTSAPRPATADRTAAARAIWQETIPAPGTLTDLYLTARGYVGTIIPPAIRHHPAAEYWHSGRLTARLPAMVASVSDITSGRFLGVHRTFLDPEISPNPVAKARVPGAAKKALGAISGGGVFLGFPTDDLGEVMVAEGIETALAATDARRAAAVRAMLESDRERRAIEADAIKDPDAREAAVAALGTAGLTALRLPAITRRVLIVVDPDPPGVTAAEAAARRWCHEGRTVAFVESEAVA